MRAPPNSPATTHTSIFSACANNTTIDTLKLHPSARRVLMDSRNSHNTDTTLMLPLVYPKKMDINNNNNIHSVISSRIRKRCRSMPYTLNSSLVSNNKQLKSDLHSSVQHGCNKCQSSGVCLHRVLHKLQQLNDTSSSSVPELCEDRHDNNSKENNDMLDDTQEQTIIEVELAPGTQQMHLL